MSDDQVQCLLQDSHGFIWIGTRNGLNCYDGNHFIIYKHQDSEPGSISNNSINSIFEDSHHQLWIGTYGGLNKFDRNMQTFHVFTHNKTDRKSISNNFVTTITEDSYGYLWIGTRYGLNKYLPDSNKFLHFFHHPGDTNSINSNNIFQIVKDVAVPGNLWIITSFGLNRYNASNRHFIYSANETIRFSHYTAALFNDSENRLWFGTQSALYRVDPKTNGTFALKQILVNYPFCSIKSIVEGTHHNLWIGTRNGLVKYNYVTKKLSQFSHQTCDRYSLTKSEIWQVLYDKQGLLWIATYKGGVNILNTRNNMIRLYRTIPSSPHSLDNSFVLSFLEDRDGSIWIGTDGGGLSKFDPKHNRFKVYGLNRNGTSSIGSNTILSLLQDKKGYIWLGTWNGGICRFDRKRNTFKIFRANPSKKDSLNNPNVWSMLEDHNGNLWIGTMGGGLNKFDRKTGRFSHYIYNSSEPDSSYTDDNNVWTLFQDSKNRIWVGSSRCLNLFDPKTGHFKHFYRTGSSGKNRRAVEVICIFEDYKGRIWVGTGSNGLSLLTGDHLVKWGEKEGIPDVSVFGILGDSHGNLWMSTNNGMYRYNPDMYLSTNFDFADGLQGNQFNQGAYMLARNGRMYFGGPDGFNVFYPDSLRHNNSESPVVLTDFKLFNELMPIGGNSPLHKAINQSDEITLTYNQSVFTIDFSCLSYINPEKNQYAFMLQGFDKTWNYVGTKHDATYTNLDPGVYEFKVKAANNDGFWGKSIKILKIIIKPPFWLTLWFKILLSIAVILLLFGFYFWKIKQIARQNALLEHLVNQRTKELESRTNEVEEKNTLLLSQTQTLNEVNRILEERQQHIEEQTEELRNQKEVLEINRDELSQLNATKDKLFSILAHDLRNPFQSIVGFSELLKNEVHKLPKEKVTKYLNLIYTSSIRGNYLLNNILQWSRNQTGRIHFEPEFLDLNEMINEIVGLLAADAQQKNITIDSLVKTGTRVYADKNMLQTILRNLLSNALKFTFESGRIAFNAKYIENFAEISVADNGVGIPPKNQERLFRIDQTVTTQGTAHESGTGLGLILCREFVERHGGTIWFESEPDQGTTFFFTLSIPR